MSKLTSCDLWCLFIHAEEVRLMYVNIIHMNFVKFGFSCNKTQLYSIVLFSFHFYKACYSWSLGVVNSSRFMHVYLSVL